MKTFRGILWELVLKTLLKLGGLKATFGFSEPGVPVIPPAVMWQNVLAGLAAAQAGTVISGATTCTAMTATNGLYVGMGISGTGIAPGTTIAAIVSGTAITLSLPATASGSPTLTFTLNDPNNSIWAAGFLGFPSPSPASIATDTPDCPFNIPDAQNLVTSAVYVPAPGRGVVTIAGGTVTASTIQYNINGTWTTIYTGTISATVGFYVMADGVNVRWQCLSTTNSVFTFYRERSSKSTSI
jgi:hypothetical protein